MIIDQTNTLQELTLVFAEYEQALVNNDVETLDRLFWNDPRTIRYGAGENLYGFAEIQEFRNSRSPKGLNRTIKRQSITTYGDSLGCTHIEYVNLSSGKAGRQTQTWIKKDNRWLVVSAHVSWLEQM